ncbi:MAG: carboxy-S-adenosyl-L-methionine synthase CmoA [Candidatus Bathyarchaeia archaeon]
MKHDQIFRETTARASDFEFNNEIAKVFDDMLVRSVPFYLEQQFMISDIAKKFWIPSTDVYDLGCSTGTTLINMCSKIEGPGYFIGYDNSTPMLEQAKQKIKQHELKNRIKLRYGDLNGDLSKLQMNNASVVTSCWTLQFIRPLQRDKLIKWIYNRLVENGVLVVTEKILTNNSSMNRFFIDFYYDFKRRNQYSREEIDRKREALENVLVPYRIDENLDMFRRNGFEIVEIFFQWYNFAGFLCVKKPL